MMSRKTIEARVVEKVKANPTKPKLTQPERETLRMMVARQIIAQRRRDA
jgi:hypothetical protein